MSYELRFSKRAMGDLEHIKSSGNNAAIKKTRQILRELMEHPYTGTGRPEKLKYRENFYSRRITQKDRIVYSIHENIVTVDILQMMGHYEDK